MLYVLVQKAPHRRYKILAARIQVSWVVRVLRVHHNDCNNIFARRKEFDNLA